MLCGKCGKEINEDAKFCPYCGTAVGETPEEVQGDLTGNVLEEVSEDTGKKKKRPIYKRVWFWILVFLAAVVVAAELFGVDPNEAEHVTEEETENTEETEETESSEIDKENWKSLPEMKESNMPETIDADYEAIYKGVMDYIYTGVRETGGTMDWLQYTLYDMNGDGYLEFIMISGTCDADSMYEIYTTDGEKAIPLGEISAFSSGLYKNMEGNGVYKDSCHMGHETVSLITAQGNGLKEKVIFDQDMTDEYIGGNMEELQHPIKFYYLSDGVSFDPTHSNSKPYTTLKSGKYTYDEGSYVFRIGVPYEEDGLLQTMVFVGDEEDEYKFDSVGVVYEDKQEIMTQYGSFSFDSAKGTISGDGLYSLVYYAEFCGTEFHVEDESVAYTYYLTEEYEY